MEIKFGCPETSKGNKGLQTLMQPRRKASQFAPLGLAFFFRALNWRKSLFLSFPLPPAPQLFIFMHFHAFISFPPDFFLIIFPLSRRFKPTLTLRCFLSGMIYFFYHLNIQRNPLPKGFPSPKLPVVNSNGEQQGRGWAKYKIVWFTGTSGENQRTSFAISSLLIFYWNPIWNQRRKEWGCGWDPFEWILEKPPRKIWWGPENFHIFVWWSDEIGSNWLRNEWNGQMLSHFPQAYSPVPIPTHMTRHEPPLPLSKGPLISRFPNWTEMESSSSSRSRKIESKGSL